MEVAFTLDLETMTPGQWFGLPRQVTDAVITPDGSLALLVSGVPFSGAPGSGDNKITAINLSNGTVSKIALPENAEARALALDQ